MNVHDAEESDGDLPASTAVRREQLQAVGVLPRVDPTTQSTNRRLDDCDPWKSRDADKTQHAS